MTPPSPRNSWISAALSLLPYALETALLLVALTVYKKAGRPLGQFVGTPAGHLLVLGTCASVALGLATAGVLLNSNLRRQFLPLAAWNTFSTARLD